MSAITFDGNTHTLTLFDSQNKQIGQWHANNITDRAKSKLKFIPNGDYLFLDRQLPLRHSQPNFDTLNGKFGRFGIVRLNPFRVDGHTHDGVGIHAGHANKQGADHPTYGCIRTTDDAMQIVTGHMKKDPLTVLHVQNNHDQYKSQPHLAGDNHHTQ